MYNASEKLLVRGRPEADESFCGYVLRLAEMNLYERPSLLLDAASRRGRVQGGALVFSGKGELEEGIAELAGVEAVAVAALKYQPAGGGVAAAAAAQAAVMNGEYYMFDAPVSPRLIRWDSPRACPSCLGESPYLRKIWDLRPITCCPLHKCLLIENCPSCGEDLHPLNRRSVNVCRCGFDLGSCRPTPAADGELALTEMLHRLCGAPGGAGDDEISGNALRELPLNEVATILYFFAGRVAGASGNNAISVERGRKIAETHALLNQAYGVFEDWPHGFHDFLDRWKADAAASAGASNDDRDRGARAGTGVIRDFGKLYSHFHRDLKADAYGFMKEAFDDYLLTRWSGGTTTNILRRMSEGAEHKQRFMSRKRACIRLGIDRPTMLRFVESGKLKTVVSSDPGKRLVLVERASVERLRSQFDTGLPARTVAGVLGVCKESVRQLIDHGCLNLLRGPSADGTSFQLFAAEEVDRLRAALDRWAANDTAGVLPGSAGARQVSFTAACVKMRKCGLGIGEFLELMLRGEFSPVGRTSEKVLKGLLFDGDELARFVRERKKAMGDDRLPAKVARKMMRCTGADVGLLRERGLVGPAEGERTGVRREVVDHFNSTYVFAAALSRGHKIRCGSFAVRALAARGVKPVVVLGSASGGGRPLFARKDLKGINLKALLAGAKNNEERRERKSLYNPAEAAGLLGVSAAEIERLVEYGLLAPSTHRTRPHRAGSDPLFKKEAVSRCRQLMRHDPPLISLNATARLLGESVKDVKRLRIRAGRLEPVKINFQGAKLQSNKIFFARQDVKRVKQIKDEGLSMKDAERILGVSRTVIRKLIRRGQLAVLSGPDVDGYKSYTFRKSEIRRMGRIMGPSAIARGNDTTLFGKHA